MNPSDPKRYLAIDLGAESGRVMLATLTDERLEIEEIHRFPNGPISVLGTLRWNLLQLWEEVLTGLRMVSRRKEAIRSVSVDSWGVDYVLVRGLEPMVGPAYHYRDERALGPYEQLRKKPGEAFIYERTGIQFMPLNSLFQLAADWGRDPAWMGGSSILMIADWFHWMLSGRKTIEETNASTTQLYNPLQRTWAWDLIDSLELPRSLFRYEVVPPGTVLGPMTDSVLERTKLGFSGRKPEVVACCTHDTGSAVAAVPAQEGEEWAYLSSGTWSLIGVELAEPLITEGARRANFTNELGFGRSVRFLRNIVGMWLLQECRRVWTEEGEDCSYAHLTDLAKEAEPLRSLIAPDDPRFLAPGDMPLRIQQFCKETGQPLPATYGQFARCIFESLAMLYAIRLAELEILTGRSLRTLHIVGGGSRNSLLNQFAADATGRLVIAGPVEATAIGNVLVQSLAMGDIPDLATARRIVDGSFSVQRYEPRRLPEWQEAHRRFTRLGDRSAKTVVV